MLSALSTHRLRTAFGPRAFARQAAQASCGQLTAADKELRCLLLHMSAPLGFSFNLPMSR